MRIKISKEHAQALAWESELENDEYGWEFVDDTGWEDDGKYDVRVIVVKSEKFPERFFALAMSRTGSYYTDYYTEFADELYEVRPATHTITYWKAVGNEDSD